MIRLRRLALATAVLAAGPAAADEYTRFEPLPVTGATRPGEAPGCEALALLNLPSSWRAGDAVVVMMTATRVPDATRDPLVAALLGERAAVLELPADRCTPADPLAGAFGALAALRQVAGAGLVVAVGYGPGGRTALAAVREEEAAARLGPGGPRYAAAAAIGEGAPAFALGAAQPSAEAAPRRLALFCDALGAVAGGLAEALRPGPAAGTETCRGAMAGSLAIRAAASRD
jgi:hypothetical protein